MSADLVEELTELVRQSERAIEFQVRAAEELDDKSEQMIKVGLASIAGGAALASWLTSTEPAGGGSFPAAFLLFAGLANLVSLGFFLAAYMGIFRHTEYRTAVAPGALLMGWRRYEWDFGRILLTRSPVMRTT